MSNNWSEYVSFDATCRRAGGRRHYNAGRQLQVLLRRNQVAKLFGVYGFEHGAQAAIARQLGVHRSTICRDISALLAQVWGGRYLVECHIAGWPLAMIAKKLGLSQAIARSLLDDALRQRCFELHLNVDSEWPMPYSEIAKKLRMTEQDVCGHIEAAYRDWKRQQRAR